MAPHPSLHHPAPARPIPPSATDTRIPPPVHVLIVERDAMARHGLNQVLRSSAALTVAGAVATIREATYLSASTAVDVVLVGSAVTDMEGTDGIGRLLTRFLQARIVLLTEETGSSWLVPALCAGADGVLPRSIEPAALQRAILSVAQGEIAVSRVGTTSLVAALRLGTDRDRAADALARLSPRERDVLAELTVGRSNAEIGARLGLRQSTVKTHVSSILQKAGVRSRHELATPHPPVQATA